MQGMDAAAVEDGLARRHNDLMVGRLRFRGPLLTFALRTTSWRAFFFLQCRVGLMQGCVRRASHNHQRQA